MKIAIDAMGGDFAPAEIVKGAVIGAREHGVGIILVGPQDVIKAELAKNDTSGLDIEIVHTDEYLIEGEQPALALRTKRNASIALATKLVKEGKAQAVATMGPTGGVVTSALMFLGMIGDLSRPVISGNYCGFAPKTIVMDIGGNMDCRPDQLVDFAIVGAVYARKMMGVPDPKVALLNVGKEEGKGNELAKATYPLLKKSGLNFIGNIEGTDISTGKANVVVCDGFTGNVAVKYCECLGTVIAGWLETKLKGEVPESKIKELTRELIHNTVISDTNGGGPLLGVDGVVFKGHGRSRALEMAATIRTAKSFVDNDVVNALKTELAAIRSKMSS